MIVVRVLRIEPNKAYGDTRDMWVAAATWTDGIYTDPLDTKREAMVDAAEMLKA